MTTGYFVEFCNGDVGPFRTREDAEAYRRYEGNLDETQVFMSNATDEMIDLATFCPDAVPQSFNLDRWQHCTVIAALVHYALSIAEPSECIRCLETLCPEPKEPWNLTIHQARRSWLALDKLADDEVAAMREP